MQTRDYLVVSPRGVEFLLISTCIDSLSKSINQNTLKKETDLLLSIKESEELSSTSLNIDDNSIVSTVEMDHSEHRKLRQVKSILKKMRKGDNENDTTGAIKAEKYTQSTF